MTSAEFVIVVERLVRDRAQLRALEEAARSAGRELDWDALAASYQGEVPDVHMS